MEILNFLHMNLRRLISVVGMAAIAAALTAVLLSNSSDTYQAEAVLFAGRALPSDRSAIDLGPFVSDLDTVLSLDPTIDKVSEATGVSPENIVLTTRVSGDRSNLSVSAEQATAEQAEAVAGEAARAALRTLLDQEVARAERSAESAETSLLEAKADLEKFRGDNATYNPVAEYEIVFGTLRTIQLQLLDPNLTAGEKADLTDREPNLEDELTRLTPLQQPYNDLVQNVTRSETAYDQTARQVRTAEAALAGAESNDFVIVTSAELVSSRDTVMSGMVAAIIVVGLLSVALFVVVDRRMGRGRDDDEVVIDLDADHGEPTRPIPAVAEPLLANGHSATASSLRAENKPDGGTAEPVAPSVSTVERSNTEAEFDGDLDDLLDELLRHGSAVNGAGFEQATTNGHRTDETPDDDPDGIDEENPVLNDAVVTAEWNLMNGTARLADTANSEESDVPEQDPDGAEADDDNPDLDDDADYDDDDAADDDSDPSAADTQQESAFAKNVSSRRSQKNRRPGRNRRR